MMLRVKDVEKFMQFYCFLLGMSLFRATGHPETIFNIHFLFTFWTIGGREKKGIMGVRGIPSG